METIIIPFSTKLKKTFIKILIFLVIIFLAQILFFSIFSNELLLKNTQLFYFILLGTTILLLWGYLTYALSLKIKNNKPQLIINQDGVISCGLITSKKFLKWSDIEYIEYKNVIFGKSEPINLFVFHINKNFLDIEYKNFIYKFMIWFSVKKTGGEISYPEDIFENEKNNVINIFRNNVKFINKS